MVIAMASDMIKCELCGRPANAKPVIQYWKADDGSVICDHCHERVAKKTGVEAKEVVQEAPESAYAGDKFDYRVVAYTDEADLKALGRKGWELVSVVAQSAGLLNTGAPEVKLFLKRKL